MSLEQEIQRRRTFAIISHPDAGKTTLTEKLLLFGGAITIAGAVKSKKASRYATSDFMEIERQRGISVATSVMGFECAGVRINLLDTPGHEDFCEDTYRTLTAVDSVVMVIDQVKGVEAQTIKLLEVCRMRHSPIMTFINKLDREGRDPFELLDEIEKVLKIKVFPMSWPVGMGKDFKGVYSIFDKKMILFAPRGATLDKDIVEISDLASPRLDELVGDYLANKLRDDVAMIEGVYTAFSEEDYRGGTVTPVFFGSAVNNFGVRELLECFIRLAPSPLPKQTDKSVISPDAKGFSGFIFKIHANMDPKHRNRIAFLRVCSGKFERNARYYHVRHDKFFSYSSPTAFMAQDKSVIDEAYPGDIIGIPDTGSGNFKIGDTLTEGDAFTYTGIPRFSPEIFRYMVNKDPMRAKQLDKGIDQLIDEGMAQLFTSKHSTRKIVGTVGVLQFEVIQYRLLHEYGASCSFEPVEIIKACWVTCDDKSAFAAFLQSESQYISYDHDEAPVYLARSNWALDHAREKYPKIQFHFMSEH
jgi:peptide chain release factor 3